MSSITLTVSIPKWMSDQINLKKGKGSSDRVQDLLMKGYLYELNLMKAATLKNEEEKPNKLHHGVVVELDPPKNSLILGNFAINEQSSEMLA